MKFVNPVARVRESTADLVIKGKAAFGCLFLSLPAAALSGANMASPGSRSCLFTYRRSGNKKPRKALFYQEARVGFVTLRIFHAERAKEKK